MISVKTVSVHVSNILAKLGSRHARRGRGHGPPPAPVRLTPAPARRPHLFR
ncbi:hypothetical protein [Nonomuraea rubra]|uniref:hypothetical protein n=1 Tax=Nonomuraea rubra TaxID=46180 RepID=UPI0031E89F46